MRDLIKQMICVKLIPMRHVAIGYSPMPLKRIVGLRKTIYDYSF